MIDTNRELPIHDTVSGIGELDARSRRQLKRIDQVATAALGFMAGMLVMAILIFLVR